MPAGEPGSDEDTQEYPVFAGPYPLPAPPADPGQPAAGEYHLAPPPTTWPGRKVAPDRAATPGVARTATARRRAGPYPTSALAAMAGIVLLLFGLALSVVGGAGVVLPDLMDTVVRIARDTGVELRGRELRALLASAAWVVLVVGVLHLVSAVGVIGHREWGRLLGLALALPGTLLGAYGVAQSLTLSQAGVVVGAAPIAAAVVATGYGIVLFGLVAGGSHFRPGDDVTNDRRAPR